MQRRASDDMSESHPHSTPFESQPASVANGDTAAADHKSERARAETPAEPNKLLAGCSYLGVLFLIPLLSETKDEFVRFHLRQGVVMFAIGVIASFGFHYRRGGSMLMLAVVVVSLVAAFRAWRGDRWQLPVIGKYAAKIEL